MNIEIKGIIPPIVTPLTEDYKINEKSLRNLIDHLINSGVHGLFPAGTTGEFYALTDDEYKKLLYITVDQTAGRVPVYAGVNHISTLGAIKLCKIAEECGVDAISVLTPMFVSPNQDELYKYFKDIAESTHLPIIMYNNRAKTGVHIDPSTVSRLADVNNIVAVKDSTGDMTNTEEYLRLTKGKNFQVLMGRDTMIFAGMGYGTSGAIASCANIAPKLTVEIYEYFINKEYDKALEAQYKLAPLRIATGLGTFPLVIKEALNMQGFNVGPCFSPIEELKEEDKIKLKELLEELNLL